MADDTNKMLEELRRDLAAMTAEERARLEDMRAKDARAWLPFPGPQSDGYHSQADLTFYGGSAGSGKSDLGIGLALTQHKRSLIIRREFVQLTGLTERIIEIRGTRDGYSGGSPPILRTEDGRYIQFGACQFPGDEIAHQGIPFDFKYIDEAVQLLESQVRFHLGWLRSSDPTQRVRCLLGSNASWTSEGAWLRRMFSAWIDRGTHPRPAEFGELRWFLTLSDGSEKELDEEPREVSPGRRPVEVQGQTLYATSRTMIRARLQDNPILFNSGKYQAVLDGLPEPIRSAVRDGDWSASQVDAKTQIIATRHIDEAMRRWKPDGYRTHQMTCMAFDPAGGGADAAVLCFRHGPWYGPLISEKGKQTAEATTGVNNIFTHRKDHCAVVLDFGGGYAGAIRTRLEDNGVTIQPFRGAGASTAKSLGNDLPFANQRTEAIYRFAEALDPNQEGGCQIALPPDEELKADLASFCYDARVLEVNGKLQALPKENIRKTLGRSPGKGDAVIMAWFPGFAAVKRKQHQNQPRPTHANVGFAHMKGNRVSHDGRPRPGQSRNPTGEGVWARGDRWK